MLKGICIIADVNMSSKMASFALRLHMNALPALALMVMIFYKYNVAFFVERFTYMVLTSPLHGFKCQWHPRSHIGLEFATKRSRVDTPTLYGSTPLVPRPGPRFMNLQGELMNGKGLE